MRNTASLIVLAAAIAAALWQMPHGASPVYACTGSVGTLESIAARAEIIVVGEAIDVGGSENNAPTLTPTRTATAAPRSGLGTPPVQVLSPTPTRIPYPEDIDLNGLGATISVESVIVGTPSEPFLVDRSSRARIEREVRESNAGTLPLTDCRIDTGVPRYQQGGRYLIFIVTADAGYEPYSAVFRLDANDVVFDDVLLMKGGFDIGSLFMERSTYDRFFRGVPAEGLSFPGATIHVTGRVPLANVLRAIAALRGDPSIAPPATGNAGLAAGR